MGSNISNIDARIIEVSGKINGAVVLIFSLERSITERRDELEPAIRYLCNFKDMIEHESFRRSLLSALESLMKIESRFFDELCKAEFALGELRLFIQKLEGVPGLVGLHYHYDRRVRDLREKIEGAFSSFGRAKVIYYDFNKLLSDYKRLIQGVDS